MFRQLPSNPEAMVPVPEMKSEEKEERRENRRQHTEHTTINSQCSAQIHCVVLY